MGGGGNQHNGLEVWGVMEERYTIGCDFGTLSMRAVLVRLRDGEVVAEETFDYPHGVITGQLPESGVLLSGPGWALQDPDDYLQALEHCVPTVVKESGVDPAAIIAMGVDFTTCTVVPLDEKLVPLCKNPRFRDRPHAWIKLWKNHTAGPEANDITRIVAQKGWHTLDDYGFRASSEWFFSKILEIIRKDEDTYRQTYTYSEAGDYIVSQLVGKMVRSGVLAAAKGLYDNVNNRYPDKEFFRALDPRMENIVEEKHLDNIQQVGSVAGGLTAGMAGRLGLKEGTTICVAHADAGCALPGAGLVQPNEMLFVMGTSTCHMMMAETKEQIPGMFGVYYNGILPGYYAYEAGQGAVGDIFDWFCRRFVPQSYYEEADQRGIAIQKLLDEKAAKLKVGESGVIALDWMNGNRCILQNSELTGLFMGLTLSTTAEEVYRALLEATAFGTKVIMDQFAAYHVPVKGVYACGGLAHKSPVVMQIYADVLGLPIKVSAVKQTSALSTSIFAAVAAGSAKGGYDDYATAVSRMVKPPKREYFPIPENVERYQKLFAIYREMHDLLGKEGSPMLRLRELQRECL